MNIRKDEPSKFRNRKFSIQKQTDNKFGLKKR